MQSSLEQRYSIKFCVKLGKSGPETVEMIRKAYGQDALSSSQIYKWYKDFKEGRESVEDEQRSGRPSTSRTHENVVTVKAALDTDRRLNIRLIADQMGLPKSESPRSPLRGSFITTMSPPTPSCLSANFWQKKILQRFHTLPTAPTWPPVIIFCF